MLRMYLSMLFNLIILGWTGYTMWWYFRVWEKDRPWDKKMFLFRYYTLNSNILSAFASGVVLLAECANLSSGQATLPDWVMLLRFTGSSAVCVTMLTVIFFLGPTAGWGLLYKDDGLYMHTIGPILAILAFALLEKDCRISFPLSLLGASTVLIYALIYLYMVIGKGEANGGWPDFYGFNRRPGMWKVSFPVMILGGCLVSLLLALVHNL